MCKSHKDDPLLTQCQIAIDADHQFLSSVEKTKHRNDGWVRVTSLQLSNSTLHGHKSTIDLRPPGRNGLTEARKAGKCCFIQDRDSASAAVTSVVDLEPRSSDRYRACT